MGNGGENGGSARLDVTKAASAIDLAVHLCFTCPTE